MDLIRFSLPGLLILGLVRSVTSYTFLLPFSFNEDGDAFIEYKGTIYLSEETRNIVYKDDEGCTVKLHLRRPQPKERRNGRGYIGGSR
ncbi:unnamed protein product [Dicrocoelium dendriticum]|nr:unnamed protein product [Dicrocoelium dendriticum]